MTEHFNDLMREIEEFGRNNDSIYSEKESRMRNIAKTTGQFLGMLLELSNSRRVLEIGTSNGYSTLWLAKSLKKLNGTVTTIEYLESKAELASKNFNRSGFADVIDLVHGDGGAYLASTESNSFDFILLDSDRKEYVTWWEDLVRVIKPGGMIVMDNAVSHQSELTDFLSLVSNSDGCESVLLPFDSGVLLIKF